MAYFSKFPSLAYDFNVITGGRVPEPNIVTDIFKRIAIKQNLENVAAIFLAYTVKDGDTPESIAHKLYGSAKLHWVVLLANDIINPFFDWPLTETEFPAFIEKKYLGSTFFLDPTLINGNFLEGLPITTSTASATGTVLEVDVTLSSLVVTDIVGVFEESDTLEQDVGALTPVTAELTRRVLFTKDALHHFEDAQGKVLNPLTHRDGYIQGGFGSPPDVNVVTNLDHERALNEARRQIQLIDPSYVDLLLRDLETIFRRNALRRT